MYTDESKTLAKAVATTGSLRFGFFVLRNGKVSPYFMDMKPFIGFPRIYKAILRLTTKNVMERIDLDSYQRVCGVPMAGIPLATGLALELEKPLVCVRKGKPRGDLMKRLEGPLFTGDRVLVVDDVCATGSSIAKVSDVIISEGGLVEQAFVIMDMEEGGNERLSSKGIKLFSLTKISEIANILLEMESINESQRNAIMKRIESFTKKA